MCTTIYRDLLSASAQSQKQKWAEWDSNPRPFDICIILSVERSSQAELSAQEIFRFNCHLSLLAFPLDGATHGWVKVLL